MNEIQQFPNELEPFIQFMIDNNVRSFMEVGCRTAHLSLFLRDLLGLDRIVVCDRRIIKVLDDNPEIEHFQGDIHTRKYRRWRKKLGHIDMVFLDAAHDHEMVRKEFKTEKIFSHNFIAIHDVYNKKYPGLKRFWKREVKGDKIMFINKDKDSRLISMTDANNKAMRKYRIRFGTSCGIGEVRKK